MNTRLKIALFVICLIILLAFQSKLVMPTVYKVIASDLFLEETKDIGSQLPVKTQMTQLAFEQCNTQIAKEIDENFTVSFPKQPIQAWDVGNYNYIINADIEITPANAAKLTKRYACNIQYDNKDDMTGVSNAENWSINGLSGLEGL